MSIDKEKPRKAPAKKAAAAEKPKAVSAKAKPAVKAAGEATAPGPAKKAKTAEKAASAIETAAIGPASTEQQAPAAKVPPTHEQIAYRAYFYFVERGWQHGNDHQDWLRAERELSAAL